MCTGNTIKSATIQVDLSPIGGIPTSYMINTTSGTASYAVNVPALPSGSLVAYTIPNANISVIKPGDYSITVTAINCAGRQPTSEYLPDHAITVIDPSVRQYVGVHQLGCM